ncbi:prolyl oligopeptidase family serine peptidase [Pseudonocardia sp. MCCB 268]|nr:prolyl oligopeptidase family serine peptidase [Pseudonocardia cytotoxica]
MPDGHQDRLGRGPRRSDPHPGHPPAERHAGDRGGRCSGCIRPDLDDADVHARVFAVWADAGWTVISTNYRGSTGYGAAWRQAIVGRPGLTELGVTSPRSMTGPSPKRIADPERMLAGSSWGGYLTLPRWACSSSAGGRCRAGAHRPRQ